MYDIVLYYIDFLSDMLNYSLTCLFHTFCVCVCVMNWKYIFYTYNNSTFLVGFAWHLLERGWGGTLKRHFKHICTSHGSYFSRMKPSQYQTSLICYQSIQSRKLYPKCGQKPGDNGSMA